MPRGSDLALVRDVYAMDAAFMGLGNTVIEEPGATLVHNPDALSVRDANHVSLTAHEEVPTLDTLLAYTDTTLAGAPARTMKTSPLTPPAIAAQLMCRGFEWDQGIMLLLEGPLQATAPDFEVRLVETDADWAAWDVLHAQNWAETGEKVQIDFSPAFVRQYEAVKRGRTRAIQYWVAYADGAPRAYLSSWEGLNGIGMLEDLFTAPAYRHRGLATALLVHAAADVRARGAGRIVVPADAVDTPKHMYTAMGFRPLSVHRTFWRIKA